MEIEISNSKPLDVANLQPPIMIMPMTEWNKTLQKGLRFALKLSPDIFVVEVRASEKMDELQKRWSEMVEAPTRAAWRPTPRLVQLPSPYLKALLLLRGDENIDGQVVTVDFWWSAFRSITDFHCAHDAPGFAGVLRKSGHILFARQNAI